MKKEKLNQLAKIADKINAQAEKVIINSDNFLSFLKVEEAKNFKRRNEASKKEDKFFSSLIEKYCKDDNSPLKHIRSKQKATEEEKATLQRLRNEEKPTEEETTKEEAIKQLKEEVSSRLYNIVVFYNVLITKFILINSDNMRDVNELKQVFNNSVYQTYNKESKPFNYILSKIENRWSYDELKAYISINQNILKNYDALKINLSCDYLSLKYDIEEARKSIFNSPYNNWQINAVEDRNISSLIDYKKAYKTKIEEVRKIKKIKDKIALLQDEIAKIKSEYKNK